MQSHSTDPIKKRCLLSVAPAWGVALLSFIAIWQVNAWTIYETGISQNNNVPGNAEVRFERWDGVPSRPFTTFSTRLVNGVLSVPTISTGHYVVYLGGRVWTAIVPAGTGTNTLTELATYALNFSILTTTNLYKAKISSADTNAAFLEDKIISGSNVTITKSGTGANELLTIASSAIAAGSLQTVRTLSELQAVNPNATNFVVFADGLADGIFYGTNTVSGTNHTASAPGARTSSTTAGWSWQRLYSGPVYAAWWGETSDGVTDDSVAINAAINAVTNISTVILGNGTQRLANPILINRSDVTLRGQGNRQTGNNGSHLKPDVGVDAIKIASTANTQGTRIENLMISPAAASTNAGIVIGNATPQFYTAYTKLDRLFITGFTGANGGAVKVITAQELDIENCRLQGNYNNVHFRDPVAWETDGFLTSIHIHGMAGYIGLASNCGILLEGRPAAFTVSDIVIESNGTNAFRYPGTAASGPSNPQFNILNCHIEANSVGTTNPVIYIHGGASASASVKVNIKNNFFYELNKTVLDFDRIFSSTISGNSGLWQGTTPVVTTANVDMTVMEDRSNPDDSVSTWTSLLPGSITVLERGKLNLPLSIGVGTSASDNVMEVNMGTNGQIKWSYDDSDGSPAVEASWRLWTNGVTHLIMTGVPTFRVSGSGLFTGGTADPGDGTPAGTRVGFESGHGFIQAAETSLVYYPVSVQPLGGVTGIGMIPTVGEPKLQTPSASATRIDRPPWIGTITNGGTLTLDIETNKYRLKVEGAAWTILVPASAPSTNHEGFWIEVTNTVATVASFNKLLYRQAITNGVDSVTNSLATANFWMRILPSNDGTLVFNQLIVTDDDFSRSSGSSSVPDPIVPADGTQNITGGLSVAGKITGAATATEHALTLDITPTSDPATVNVGLIQHKNVAGASGFRFVDHNYSATNNSEKGAVAWGNTNQGAPYNGNVYLGSSDLFGTAPWSPTTLVPIRLIQYGKVGAVTGDNWVPIELDTAANINFWKGAWTSKVLGTRLKQSDGVWSIYNTYTDDSNYERIRIGWELNAISIYSEAGGTGTPRPFNIGQVVSGGAALSFSVNGELKFIKAQVDDVATMYPSGGLFLGTGESDPGTGGLKASGVITGLSTTESTSKDTGGAIFEGGIGVEKKGFFGTGVASTATDTSVTIDSSGWTNTFGKNANIFLEYTNATWTVYNNAGTAVFTNGLTTGPHIVTIPLQVSGKIIVTSGAISGTAVPW